jgi:hypothetical protein
MLYVFISAIQHDDRWTSMAEEAKKKESSGRRFSPDGSNDL